MNLIAELLGKCSPYFVNERPLEGFFRSPVKYCLWAVLWHTAVATLRLTNTLFIPSHEAHITLAIGEKRQQKSYFKQKIQAEISKSGLSYLRITKHKSKGFKEMKYL